MATELYYPKAKKNVGGTMKTYARYAKGYPQGAIVHFTASAPNAVNVIKYSIGKGYCFFTIGPDGTVYQNAPVDRWGSHAGKSRHQKLGDGISRYLVGIEVVTAGKLVTKNGKLKTYFGTIVPASEIRKGPKKANCEAGSYHKYSTAQEKSLLALLLWLKSNKPSVFKFEFGLGHDEVSPGRKNDPGWALSMTMPQYRAYLRAQGGGAPVDLPEAPEEAELALRYAPRSFSPEMAAFQKAASQYPGIDLVVDGLGGKGSSDAFHLLSGFYLKGDKRAKDTPDLDAPSNPAPRKIPAGSRRQKIGRQIVNWEARRDSQGHLKVYKLPWNDGGGTYEVAGINDNYHPAAAKKLKALLAAKKFEEAESYVAEYLCKYTDVVTKWVSNIGLEAFMRDTAFNRGPTGAAKIMQIALNVAVDGKVGPNTLKALKKLETGDPIGFLKRLREARETYERKYRGYRANLWQGLVNRWNNAYAFGLSLQKSAEAKTASAEAELAMSEEASFVSREARELKPPAEPDQVLHPPLAYAPGHFSVVTEKFQEFANAVADLDLEEDGLAGPGTSRAFHQLTGYYLARDTKKGKG